MDKDAQCNESWHVFDGGLPQPNQKCKCGKQMATTMIGVTVDSLPEKNDMKIGNED